MKVCPDCKLEVNNQCSVCPECGYVFSSKKKDFNKSKRSINIVAIVIVVIIIIVLGIFFISSLLQKNSVINEKNNQVKSICEKGEYLDGVSIANVIDHYSCENFVSYLIDNDMNLTEANLEELIKKDNKNVYEVIYKYTGNDISKYYTNEIVNLAYFDFLVNNNLFSLIDEKDYSSYLSRSIDDNNLELFKILLKGNDSLKNKYSWSGEDYYFGGKFFGKTEYASTAKMTVEKLKNVANGKIEFANEYYKYSYHDKIGALALLNKELFQKAYNGQNFGQTLTSYSYFLSYLSLDDIKKYVSFGGKFYKDNNGDFEKMIKEFLNSNNQSDGGFVNKLSYILGEAKKEGYSTNYSPLLDYYVEYHSLSQMSFKDKLRKNIYKAFVNQGFKCYSSCGYVKYYK